MKQRFFTNTIQSNFIKALIYNTPIPLIKTVNKNSYLVEGNTYIYKNYLIHCTESGIITMPEVDDGYTAYYKNGEILLLNDNNVSNASSGDSSDSHIIGVLEENLSISQLGGYYDTTTEDSENAIIIYEDASYRDEDISINYQTEESTNKYEALLKNNIILSPCKYRVVGTYKFGRFYSKFTELYHSNTSYYDSETHKHLGDLLRCYRDIYDINLMPYYNCINGDYISGINIYKDRLKEENSNDYKTFKVPIKFDTTYTLALDCNSEVRIAPVLLSNNNIIKTITYYSNSGTTESITLDEELLRDNIYIFNSTSFKQPKTIGITTLNKNIATTLQKYEKYLYLLIQIPKDNNSSIVLLEGDYLNVSANHVFNFEKINKLDNLDLSDLMTTNLSLLQMNDKITYPYANRLIEYLLLAVINHTDKLTDDIKKVQKLFPYYQGVIGVWDNKLRSNIYRTYQKNRLAKQLDLNGFIDKDTEALIHRLKNK